MAHLIRRLVSQQRKRFQDDEFDLDLAYVDDNIIAMSWPADGGEGLYRNPMSDVVRMLQKYHASSYKVFNLCSERSYDAGKFEAHPVSTYPFDDHQVPPFGQLYEFVTEARDFLEAHEKNVVVIHCKAGKGRTGVAIASLLLHLGRAHSATAALAQFADRRTSNGKGVTIASQRRWVHFFELVKGLPHGRPRNRIVQLKSIVISNVTPALAKRLVIVISRSREPPHDTIGKLPRPHADTEDVLIAKIPAVSTSATFGRFLCGIPVGTMDRQKLAITAPEDREGAVLEQSQRYESTKSPFFEGAAAEHWHVGKGWRLRKSDEGHVELQLSEDREIGRWSFVGAFKVHVYIDSVARSNALFWTWQHCSFLQGTTLTLPRHELDKVSKRVPKDVSLMLSWRTETDPIVAARSRSRDDSMVLDLTDSQFRHSAAPQWGARRRGSRPVEIDPIERAQTDPCALPSTADLLADRGLLSAHVINSADQERGRRKTSPTQAVLTKPTPEQLWQKLDSAWMGGCDVSEVPDARVSVAVAPKLTSNLLHETSAFRASKASPLSQTPAQSDAQSGRRNDRDNASQPSTRRGTDADSCLDDGAERLSSVFGTATGMSSIPSTTPSWRTGIAWAGTSQMSPVLAVQSSTATSTMTPGRTPPAHAGGAGAPLGAHARSGQLASAPQLTQDRGVSLDTSTSRQTRGTMRAASPDSLNSTRIDSTTLLPSSELPGDASATSANSNLSTFGRLFRGLRAQRKPSTMQSLANPFGTVDPSSDLDGVQPMGTVSRGGVQLSAYIQDDYLPSSFDSAGAQQRGGSIADELDRQHPQHAMW